MGINSDKNSLAKSKSSSRRVVFIDRDGTLIEHVELMRSIEDIRFFPEAESAIKTLNQLGYLVVIITNQPVVARGLIDEKGIDEIHAILIKRLGEKGAKIDAVYFCPHHPDANLEKYRLKCDCRKPEPGMILKAIKKYGVDPSQSYMIGDGIVDVVAGKKAGTKTILVSTGPGHAMDKEFSDVLPDFKAANLAEAVEFIKQRMTNNG